MPKIDIVNKIKDAYLLNVKDVDAIVLGGSLARRFSDENSDIEMYLYYSNKLPSKEAIHKCLRDLDAHLTRSENVHWYHRAWGYHTFFSTEGVKVELGYRKIENVEKRIAKFLDGNILSKHGIHDTPFGHYESGLASCISESSILYENEYKKLSSLKNRLNIIPDSLKNKLISHYFEDARTVSDVKIEQAILRNDTLLFNSTFAFALRGLVITLFTINDKYFPGDKWNEEYLKNFPILPPSFSERLQEMLSFGDFVINDKRSKLSILKGLIDDTGDLVDKND